MTDPKSQSAVQRDMEKEIAEELKYMVTDVAGFAEKARQSGYVGRDVVICFAPSCRGEISDPMKLWTALVSARLRLREVEQERDTLKSVRLTNEGTCGDCGVGYPVWFAPNAVWNKVIAAGVGMLCPTCFMKRGGGLWEVRPEGYQPPEVCTCETPRRSWNPASPCLACGGKLLDQETSHQPPAPPSSQGQDAAPESGTVSLPATSEGAEDSRHTLSAESRLAQAGKLAEAARKVLERHDILTAWPGDIKCVELKPVLGDESLRTALSDFDKL